MKTPAQLVAVCGLVISGHVAAAQTVLLSQQRVIAATTTVDGNSVTAVAPDFAPFITTVTATTPFPTPAGVPAPNTGETGIDCEIDPNAITARGTLGAAGGISVTGVPVFGEAEALVEVRFSVTEPTPYRIRATPRPSTNPRDEFEVELHQVGAVGYLYRINETQPPQNVDVSGMLQPGTYVIHYEVEFTHDDGYEVRDFNFGMQLGQTCGDSDFNGDGDFGTEKDIQAFFACLGGQCCASCYSSDFNGDGDSGTEQDIESFFRVLAGHGC
jgi:hypothetical protein